MDNLTGKQFGHYEIVAPLGEGGMAAVYKAYQPSMERYVAIKVLPRQMAESPEFKARFQREARLVAQLQHPNILPVFDFGEAEGYTYVVMPFISTGTLADLLISRRLGLQEVRRIMLQLCDALAYAHATGMIHRDIKPSNVLMDARNNCLLTDFGLARMVEATSKLTSSGTILGTPAYMSPEQGMGNHLDQRSDLYSLGIMFFEMVTGRVPYTAETPLAIVFKHIQDPLPPARSLNPNLSEEIELVLLKALAKLPEDRYQSAEEMMHAIETAIPDESTTPLTPVAPVNRAPKPPVPDSVSPTPAPIPGVSSSAQVAPAISMSVQERQPRVWWPLILIVFFIVVAGAWFGLSQSKIFAPQPTTTPTPLPPTLTFTPSATPIPPTATPLPTATATVAITLNNKDRADMLLIPEGAFTMGVNEGSPYFWGAEAPEHLVYLKSFHIYRTEVTNAMYQLCAKERACRQPNTPRSRTRIAYYDNPSFANYPVIYVTWQDAKNYCKWAGARLPSEAEWEKSARGTDGRLFPWGDNDHVSDRAANNSLDTEEVGSYPNGASPYGVQDMAGNVLEWVNDYFVAEYYKMSPEKNPAGPDFGSRYVIRGGSWESEVSGLRTVARASLKPDEMIDTVGFRCAVDAP